MTDKKNCRTGCQTAKTKVDDCRPILISPKEGMRVLRECLGRGDWMVPWCFKRAGWKAGSVVFTDCGYFFNLERAFGEPQYSDSEWYQFDFLALFNMLVEDMACDTCPKWYKKSKAWDYDNLQEAKAGQVWCFDCGFACAKVDTIKSVEDAAGDWTPCVDDEALLCRLVTFKGGAKGADGTNGTDGANGTNGTHGTHGADGKDGKDGKDGAGAELDLVDYPFFEGTDNTQLPANQFIADLTLKNHLMSGFTYDAATNSAVVPIDGVYEVTSKYSVRDTPAGNNITAKIRTWINGTGVVHGTAFSFIGHSALGGIAHGDSADSTRNRILELSAGDKISIGTEPGVGLENNNKQSCSLTIKLIPRKIASAFI